MRIGDVEYTREIVHVTTGATSEFTDVAFALGIKVRPLLVRTSVSKDGIAAATNSAVVSLENGQQVAAGLTAGALLREERAHPLLVIRTTLVTSGMPMVVMPWELLWWKILLPQIRIHVVDLGTIATHVTLHYRFVELTDDEVIEIAAQRAQA